MTPLACMAGRARCRRAAAAALLVLVTLGGPATAVAQDDPVAPVGRSVCSVAFTVAAVISFSGSAVPPSAPVTPNDLVAAITPVLRLCAGLYPAAPPRQCLTSDLYPDIGLPITLPDPLGILSEEVDAVVGALGPLGAAIGGPLQDVFVSALACRDLGPGQDDGAGGPGPSPLPTVPEPSSSPTTEPAPPAPSPAPALSPPPTVAAAPSAVPVPAPPPVAAAPSPPVRSIVAVVPEPLRGPGLVVVVALVAALAVTLRRQLAPRRRDSPLR